MQDRNIKNRLIGGDVTYRITAGPDGTKLVHLYNVPGGKFDFSNLRNNYRVWYWYYDTFDREECLAKNPDVVRLPSDIPIDETRWDELNSPAKTWVRRWFTAYCKETLARVRGKYSGNLKTPDSELTLEYTTLQTEAKDEKADEVQMKIAQEVSQFTGIHVASVHVVFKGLTSTQKVGAEESSKREMAFSQE